MTDGTKHKATKIDGKSVRGTFSDGSVSITVDYKGDTPVLLPLEERETEDFRSQDIDEKAVVGKPSYGTIQQPISFSREVYAQIEKWYLEETKLTYTVSGLFDEDKTYDGIMISIPDPPHIDPERNGYLTNTIGIKSIKSPTSAKEE